MTIKQPLSVTHPELAKQAAGWDPATISYGSDAKRLWKCEIGHIWEAAINNRSAGKGCPFCSGRKVLPGVNDLASINSKLAKEAAGWDPTKVKAGSPRKMAWRCKFGHEWSASVKNRAKGIGCPICSGRQVLAGFNDLLTANPVLAEEAFGWDPSRVTRSARSRHSWKCSMGHIWIATVNARAQGRGCAVCASHQVLVGFNDLSSFSPEVASQAFDWDPNSVARTSNKKKQWKCEFGHLWIATISNRVAGNNCPICAGQEILVGFNDLTSTHPDLIREVFGWDPTTVSKGTRSKKKWKCSSGHLWEAAVSDRTQGSGCPTCARYGFDPNSEGWLYFLSHPRWGMLQIGITNFPNDRLKSHKKLGWELIEIRGPMDGLIAREWETSILQMLKRHGAKLAPDEIAGKFNGYTEAWLTESYRAQSLRALIGAVQAEEDFDR